MIKRQNMPNTKGNINILSLKPITRELKMTRGVIVSENNMSIRLVKGESKLLYGSFIPYSLCAGKYISSII